MVIYVDAMTGTFGLAKDLRIVDLEKVAESRSDPDNVDQWSLLAYLEDASDDEICDFGNWEGTHLDISTLK